MSYSQQQQQQQLTPSTGGGSGSVGGFSSRIPMLAPNSRGSASNSRLPSPPVSPGLNSPSTPITVGTMIAAPWASGGGGGGMLFSQASQDRMGSAGSGRSFPGAPTSGASAAVAAAGMWTPNSAGVRGSYAAASSSLLARGGMGGGDSMRMSLSGLARSPLSGWGVQEATATSAAAAAMGSLPSPVAGGGGGGADPATATAGAGTSSSSRSCIQVAVRVRPLCDKERQRGDRVAWEADREGNVGLLDAAGTFVPKHRFDTVFGPETDNSAVAAHVALPLVAPALRGVNGTIFAYGVTSSGKTHTMMGTDADPGVVPRVIRELFAQIAAAGSSRCFSVRISVMEIYNEVLNDLLDPNRINLKVREDSRSGLVLVEGLLEQPVSSAEQALDFIARGDHNRKVSATAFNEDSSRSHTITRIIVESTPPPAAASTPEPPSAATGDRPVGRRTTACLSLIDLAGSESARAVVSKGQRMEGSFINRSLLTLGTVIHKLAAGAAGHVPFRDSKLTRLLQPSLSGPGARVAVVCNITPAAAQTEETANTLKFAARAKLIQVTARTNEILDERSLLRRYQKEVADLKRQLAEARRLLAAAGAAAGGDGSPGGQSAAAVGAAAAAGSVSAGFAALGATSAEEAISAELQSERDARRAVEIECTMLRIKLARLQAFLEENGVNVDDVLLLGNTNTSGDLGEAAAAVAATTGSGDASALLLRDAAGGAAGAAQAAGRTNSLGLRHAISSPRLEGDGLAFVGSLGGGGGGAAAGVARPRASMSGGGHIANEAELGAAAGVRLAGWSSELHRQAAAGRRAQVSGQSSVSADDQVAEAEAEAEPAALTISEDLRAQVAAVLGAAAAAAGGGTSGSGGSGPRPCGSASGTISGSDLEIDEDLNEGIMAQIRDMITEARLSSPRPQSATSQPRSAAGDAIITTGGGAAAAGLSAGGGGRRTPFGVAAAGSRTTGGCSIGAGGGPASVSSQSQSQCHHRRSATLSTASSSYGAGGDLDLDLELQVLNADREVLHDQLVASEAANERLTAQVSELRRQLSTYEQLTRHAAGELAEIRRLKEAFQARLQRENDALRAQLTQLGVAPATVPPSPGPGGDLTDLHPQPSPSPAAAPPVQRAARAAGGGELPDRHKGGSMSEAGLGLGLGLAPQPPQSPMQLQSPHQFQHPHQHPHPQRYGVQSMAAFGSPAAVAPLWIPPRVMPAAAGAAADGETPTRASPGPGPLAATASGGGGGGGGPSARGFVVSK